jgi:Kef-type K+ transport system membrane component KefB
MLSALATEFIGVHAIFGAFLLGAIVPHESRVAVDVT